MEWRGSGVLGQLEGHWEDGSCELRQGGGCPHPSHSLQKHQSTFKNHFFHTQSSFALQPYSHHFDAIVLVLQKRDLFSLYISAVSFKTVNVCFQVSLKKQTHYRYEHGLLLTSLSLSFFFFESKQTSELKRIWQMLQEMIGRFVFIIGGPNVCVITAFWTGSIWGETFQRSTQRITATRGAPTRLWCSCGSTWEWNRTSCGSGYIMARRGERGSKI